MSADSRPCVLIVDDDADLANVMRLMLGRAGFEAHAVYSGASALDWLAARTPDAVLLDLMLPDINGFAILRRLRTSEAASPLPVIVLTARADHQTRVESQAAGASAFLTKPVKSDELVAHVRQALAAKSNHRNQQ